MGLSTFKGTYQEEITVAATSWVITHNLGTETPVVDCWYDDSGTWKKISPLSVVATSTNVVTITFTSATAGKVIVA